MSTLATEDDVQDDGADYGEQDHEPYREVEREVAVPEDQVTWQTLDPETPQQKEQPAEQQQHHRARDEQLSYAFESHTTILLLVALR